MKTLCSAIVILAFVILLPTAALAANDGKLARVASGSNDITLQTPDIRIEDPDAALLPVLSDPPEAILFDNGFSATEAVETAAGSCAGCSGWVFFKPQECWRYVSGSEERIWMYFQGNSNYAYVDTGDARHKQFIEACGNNHYIGIFWTSTTSFTNVRLWYY